MANYYISGSVVKNVGGAISLSNNHNLAFDGVSPASTYDVTGFGSKVYNGDDADKSLAGYTFAKNTDSLLSMRSSALVGAVAVFKNASVYPEYLRSINYLESRTTTKYTTAIRTGKYNTYTGKFSAGFPVSSTDAFGDDNAARSSYAVPGSLTFMVNGKTTTTQNYPAKG